MKVAKIVRRIAGVIVYAVASVFILLIGVLVLLYSPWTQETIRQALVTKMSTPANELHLDKLRIRFPLDIEAQGLAWKSDGDTIIAASALDARINPLSALTGTLKVKSLVLDDARYNVGHRDSSMYMTISASHLDFAPASVKLSSMDIDLPKGFIKGGKLFLLLNPIKSNTPSSGPTHMDIKVGDLKLDDFYYGMKLLPIMDTLSAYVAKADLARGDVDLLHQRIALGEFLAEGVDAKYLVPNDSTIAANAPYPESEESDSASLPWTIVVDTISMQNSRGLYAIQGYKPLPGLDFSYLEAENMDLTLHDFYNQMSTVKLPLHLTGRERCGLDVDIKGDLDIDSTGLTFKTFHLSTPAGTSAVFEGVLGAGTLTTDPDVALGLQLDGQFDPGDLAKAFPAFTPYLAAVPGADDIQLEIDAAGTSGRLNIPLFSLDLNRCISLQAKGTVENMFNFNRIGGNLALSGRIIDVNSFKTALLDPQTASSLAIPPMTVRGDVAMHSGKINGKLKAATKGGTIGLDADWNMDAESYDATVVARSFPVEAFMPLAGIGNLTASLHATGEGYSPFKPTTNIDVNADIKSVVYSKVPYTDIKATAHLANGLADVHVDSDNPDAELTLDAHGNLDGDTYSWQAQLDGKYIDLYKLKFATEPASVEVALTADATIGPGKSDIEATVNISDLFFRRQSGTIALNDVSAHLNASDSLTQADIHNRDMVASFTSPVSLDSLGSGFSHVADIVAEQIKIYEIDVDTLGRTMPPFTLDVVGGSSNLVNDILAPSGMSVRSFNLSVDNDSILNARGRIMRFKTGDMHLDSLYLYAHQHGQHMHVDLGMLNKPGNLDEWHKVTLNGAVEGNRSALRVHQENLEGATGFDIGMEAVANAADSCITLHVKPFNPMIGYQQWSVNDDNFFSYTIPTGHIDANLHMQGGNSSLAVYTVEGAGHDTHTDRQEDLIIKLGDIHLEDWIAVNPFAPPIQGDVNADLALNRADGLFVGHGSAGISNFLYGKEKVADFKADFDIAANTEGTIRAKADVLVDGVRTMTLSGALNDSTATSPLDLDFSVIHFPLSAANPFIPSSMGRLSGTLNGNMKISGTQKAPIMNGTLDFDSTAVRLALTGTDYKFSNVPINVVDNVATFNNFAISGCNKNPLTVNGTVDLSQLDNLKMRLALKADNMMIVDSKRLTKGADIFGKGYISLDATAHGTMKMLSVNANLSVDAGTNITYVIPDATNAIANKSNSDMVKFVNFTDSAAVAEADVIQHNMALFLDAVLTLQEGNIINVYLSSDGGDRVNLQTSGTLNYSMTPVNDGRLLGRLNIDKGFVRYTPPLMSEKLFDFYNNSYVAFTGDIMNPSLNIHAKDVIKANVTGNGQNSRLINFDVILNATGTLNHMNVAFDLATNDDMTVANELESMSPEQRANQAMNMMLYNTYTGPGTKGDSSMSVNPLYSFLESTLNSWAANNIRGIDVSFGINQYDSTLNGNTSQTIRYSYQVSKSLFNDRFKIVVGGNYSTDANADENFSQNLINDISFEYFLNKMRTMYVRLFRHTGYESILEGEITKTGVGFVYRRKLQRLGDMFLPQKYVKRREERANAASDTIETEQK